MARYYQGTLTGQTLDLDGTVKRLRKSMAGLGTDEKVIIKVLSNHTNQDLQEVKQRYKELYGRELGEDLQAELSGHFETLCLYLLLSRVHFQAYCLHQALEGLGTNETTLIEILCTRNNDEISKIKDAYKERFNSDLEEDMRSDTSGDFRRILTSVIQGNRSEQQEVDQKLVEKDVKDLLKAGVKQLGTDESVFNRILAIRSLSHLEAVFRLYADKDGQTIHGAIKQETSGSLRDAYLTLVCYVLDPLEYFADCFHQAMDGPGTDDKRLMQLVVNHYEIDLLDISQKYLEKYHVGLPRAIHDDTSGDYRKLLLGLVTPEQC